VYIMRVVLVCICCCGKCDVLCWQDCEFNPKKPVVCDKGCGLTMPKDEFNVRTIHTHLYMYFADFSFHVQVSSPAYVTDELYQVADVEARQRLRSSSSSSLIVSRTRLSTVGD